MLRIQHNKYFQEVLKKKNLDGKIYRSQSSN